MNKTKKDKYLRKNRHSKHSKHSKYGNKNKKTRKVQRGGQNDGPGNILVKSGSSIGDTGKGTAALETNRVFSGKAPPLGLSNQQINERQALRTQTRNEQYNLDMEEYKRKKQADEEEAKRIAAAERAAAAAAPKPTDVLGTGEQIIIPPSVSSSSSSPPASLPFGNFRATQPTSVGFSVGVPITKQQHHEQQQQQQQQQHPQQQEQQQQETKLLTGKSIAEDRLRLTKLTPEEIKKMDPEARVAYYNQNALDYNKLRERPDRRITLIAKSLPNAILGKIANIGSDSQKNLVREEVLTTFTGDLSKIIEDSEDQIEVIREYNRFLNEEIKEIYREVVMNGEITDRQKQDIDDLLGHIKGNTEAMKQLTVEASMLVHAIDSGSLAGLESAFGMGMLSQAQAQVQPHTSSNKPELLSEGFGIGKTQKNTNSQDPSNGEPNKVPSDIQTPEVKAAAEAHNTSVLDQEKKAGLTRVPGKTLKSRVVNMGKTVKQGFGISKNRLTRKKNKKNKEDKEPLIPKEVVYTKASSITPPSDTQAKVATPPPPPQAPPPPSPPSLTLNRSPLPPSSSSSFADDIKEAAANRSMRMQTRKALPARPTSVPSSVATEPSPPPTSRVPPPITPRPMLSQPAPQPKPFSMNDERSQDGGNITRKNRQYIYEIKDNRTQLFNKEMEIINSIRNFKHGHNHGQGRNEHGKNKPENIQKKFIKVIKRS